MAKGKIPRAKAEVKAKAKAKPGRSRLAGRKVSVRSDNCHFLFGDTVNVALSGEWVALTFYQTVPDPDTETPKGVTRHASAVVQLPLEAGVQIPGLILRQMLDRADLSPEQIDALVGQAEEMKKHLLEKRKELKR